MPGPISWLLQIPPITRTWLLLSLLTSLLVHSHLLTPLHLYSAPTLPSLLSTRTLTTFLYFGSLSLDLLFHLFFFMRYSRILEDSSFPAQPAAYLWLLLQSAAGLLLLSSIPIPGGMGGTSPFLSSSLAFVPIYVWSRRHPTTPISLFGLVTIGAAYLPYALVGFTVVVNGEWRAAQADLMGCVVGHVVWFVRDVWAREMHGGSVAAEGKWALVTQPPEVLKRVLGDA